MERWPAWPGRWSPGYEVMCRVGCLTGPQAEYARGFHPTGTAGVFGAAAGAAVVLGLEPDGVAAALGIAGSLSSGAMTPGTPRTRG